MGSHKQNKKHKRESSSSESESSSSEEERTSKRQSTKRFKQSSSDESDIETAKRNQKSSSKISKSKNAVLEKTHHRHREKIHSEELRSKYIERKDDINDVRNRSRSRDRDCTRQRRGDYYHKHEDRERKSNNKRDKPSETREKNDSRSKREYDREKHEDRYKNKEFADRRNDKWSNENYRRETNGRNEKRRRRSRSYDHVNAKWGKDDDNVKSGKTDIEKKDKPNFGLSGKLTEERNTFRGVVIKYSEPPEARKPRRRWRLYPFKGEKALQTLYIHRESAYLIGRERKVVDLPVDHPSCSKQHAALQYRLVPFTREDGSVGKRVRPYLIDLESANGTFINNKKIEPKRYVELFEKDVVKFGFSSREYVLLHENSKDEAMDDDVKQEEEEVKVKKEESTE